MDRITETRLVGQDTQGERSDLPKILQKLRF